MPEVNKVSQEQITQLATEIKRRKQNQDYAVESYKESNLAVAKMLLDNLDLMKSFYRAQNNTDLLQYLENEVPRFDDPLTKIQLQKFDDFILSTEGLKLRSEKGENLGDLWVDTQVKMNLTNTTSKSYATIAIAAAQMSISVDGNQSTDYIQKELKKLTSQQISELQENISQEQVKFFDESTKSTLEQRERELQKDISGATEELADLYRSLIPIKEQQEMLTIDEKANASQISKQNKQLLLRQQELEKKAASPEVSVKIKTCIDSFREGHIGLSQKIIDELSELELKPEDKAFVKAISNAFTSSIQNFNNNSDRRDSFSSISSRSSMETISSISSTSSGFSEFYGERKSAKKGGMKKSDSLDAGIYTGENGTYLIKSSDKSKQEDIVEYLTSVVYQSLAPNHGAEVDLVKHVDGRVFLASRFEPGYKDFHKEYGHEEKDFFTEYKAAMRGHEFNFMRKELINAMPGGTYTGYAEAMAPSMIAGNEDTKSDNMGSISNEDGTKRLYSIDFGSSVRPGTFGPDIELDRSLPQVVKGMPVPLTERNYFHRDHPEILRYTEEFAKNADAMSNVNLSFALEAAWLNVEQHFSDEIIKKFGKRMDMSEEELSSENFKDKIRDHYIKTIGERQQSLKKQFGVEQRAKNLEDPNFKINGERLEDALCRQEYATKAAQMRTTEAIKAVLNATEEIDVKEICSASGSSKHPENLKRVNGLIDEMLKDPKITQEESVNLVKIKNRVCVEHINMQMKIGKLNPTSPELVTLVQNIQIIDGNAGSIEMQQVANKLPAEVLELVNQHVINNPKHKPFQTQSNFSDVVVKLNKTNEQSKKSWISRIYGETEKLVMTQSLKQKTIKKEGSHVERIKEERVTSQSIKPFSL
jgi:hypothetical protein